MISGEKMIDRWGIHPQRMTFLRIGLWSSIVYALFSCSPAFSENISLTTYYPSPSGTYEAPLARRFAAGDVNGDGNINGSDIPSYDGYLSVADRLGIGTASPAVRLTLSNNVYTAPIGSSYGAYQLLLYDTGSAATSFGMGIESSNIGFNSAGGYKFYQAGGSTPLMVIGGASSTNVGIGTASPAYKLEVAGDLRVSNYGYFTLGNMDDTNEGGQINFNAAGSYDPWYVDSCQNSFRIFTGTSNTDTVQMFNAGSGTANLYVEGNAGIGTPASEVALDVLGRINSTMVRGQFSTYGDWSTSSTSWVNTDVVVTATTTGGPVLLLFNTQGITNTAGKMIGLRFTIDGSAVTSAALGNATVQNPPSTTTSQQAMTMFWLATSLSAGSHTFRVQVRVTGGTGYIGETSSSEGSERTLTVIEL